MRSSLWYILSLSAALFIALLLVVFRPESKLLGLTLVVLSISSPVLHRVAKGLWSWFAGRDLFSPFVAFPLAYTAWFVIGSIDFVELPSSISFGAFDPVPGRVLIYAGIGLAGYLIGAKFATSVSAGPKLVVSRFWFSWEPTMFRLAVYSLALIATATYSYIAYHIGIPLLSPDAGESRLEIANYHWAGTPFFASAYTIIFLLLGCLWMRSPFRSRQFRIISFVGLVLLFLVFMSMAGRAIIVPPILTGMIIYHYVKRRLKITTVALSFVALFAFLSVYGYVRDLTVGDSMTVWLEDAGLPRSVQPFVYCYLYVRYSVATLRDVSAVIPSHVPYQHGAVTSLPFQSVLPGHHQMADFFYKTLLGNEFLGAGQPATILGAFYSDFGPVGIFVGMFFLGLLLAKLYRWMLDERTLFRLMVFAWAMQASLFGLFGGVFTYLDTLMIPMCWVVLNFLIKSNSARTMGTLSPNALAAQSN